jgi:crotonobetainyl-CoA:carnitine CoA-transferase CaiB-like acyl-CoA transferase
MMLADLGARVIKIEAPAGGDDTWGWGPPFRLVVPGIRGSRLDSTGRTSQRRGQIRFNDYVVAPRTNAVI